jgi:hypothetical protein
MSDPVYCVRADVTALLPSGGLPNSARVATGSASGDYIDCDQHGLAANDPVTFRAEVGGSLPTGLVEGTVYYAIVVSTSRIQVAATAGGAAINLTTAGANFVMWRELPWAAWIYAAARDCDSFLPAHVVPVVEPYPAVLVTANADLAGVRGLLATGGADIDYGARLDQIGKRLTMWAKALPLRGDARSTQSPVNLAITASAGATDPRGWATGGNDVLP